MSNRFSVKGTLKEFGAKNEDDLLRKMDEESRKLNCILCGREFDIDNIHFKNGDPYCDGCYSR